MTEVILRPPIPADIPALARLGRDSFIAKFGMLYSQQDLTSFLHQTYTEAAITAELTNPARAYQLAEHDGTLMGYCKISLTCGFPGYARGARVMELKQLYTAANATGQGIGALLMDWAMAEFAARGADEVQISVYSENPGAQRFYRRYGFDKLADITFRVGDHIDAEYLFARMMGPA